MAENRNVRSRKRNINSQDIIDDKRNAKSSLINKVNAKDEPNVNSQRPSVMAKQSLKDKVKSDGNAPAATSKVDMKQEARKLSDNNKNEKKAAAASQMGKKAKKPSKFSSSKFGNLFFFKLSKVGRIMFVIYVVVIIVFGGLFINALTHKGQVVYGSRQLPTATINDDQVNEVQAALKKALPNTDAIDVSYTGFRFVVVIDMPDSSNVSAGRTANYTAYSTINKILPIKEYFSSNNELNNDLFIYSSDVVPKNYDTNSKYIYQTYKNSKMSKSLSYNLLTPRDKKSAQEVLKTMEDK